MSLIKGVTVTLYESTVVGVDAFNAPVISETAVNVDNVLITPAAPEDVTSEYELYGKHIAFTLHISKGDNHNWLDAKVVLPAPWSKTVKTYGDYQIWDAQNIPHTKWNKNIKVEAYE